MLRFCRRRKRRHFLLALVACARLLMLENSHAFLKTCTTACLVGRCPQAERICSARSTRGGHTGPKSSIFGTWPCARSAWSGVSSAARRQDIVVGAPDSEISTKMNRLTISRTSTRWFLLSYHNVCFEQTRVLCKCFWDDRGKSEPWFECMRNACAYIELC